MRPSQLEAVLYWHGQYREPIITLSAPGVGKSTTKRRVFKRLGLPHHTLNLGLSDGTDLKGLPTFVNFDGERRSVQWVKEHIFLQEKPFVLFMDEIFQGMTQVQNAAAPILLENRIDDIVLPEGSWVVGASNRMQDKAGTNRTPSHIPTRCTMAELDFHIDDWAEHLLMGGSSQDDDTPMAEYQPPLPAPTERDYRVVQYFRMKPDALSDFDPNRLVNPTPRQAEWVAQYYPVMPEGVRYDIIAGRLGDGTAAALTAFVKLSDQLPSREQILLDPKKAPVPDEPSARWLVAGMLANAASANNFDSICAYAARLPEEFQAMLVRDSMRQHPEVTSTKAYTSWAVKFAEVLR